MPARAAAILALTLTLAAVTPEVRAQVNVQTRGPQVGERIPDFSLPDQDGRSRTLQSIAGPGGAMLVFYRSADW